MARQIRPAVQHDRGGCRKQLPHGRTGQAVCSAGGCAGADAQEDVENTDFTASAGGGAVQAVVSGKKELKALTIQPDAVDPQDVEMLQDLVISAVNEALRQADEAMNNSMNSFTGGLNIPGLM